jgi:Tfp pilus assembly protein PilF
MRLECADVGTVGFLESPKRGGAVTKLRLGPQGSLNAIMSLGVSLITSARGFARVGLAAILVVGLAGCQPTVTPTPIPNAVTGQNPADVKYYPSDEPVKLGIQRFYEGNFGLAQQYFQDAVEKTPKDVTAWVGLAASYDRLGRFDLADRSYAAAVKLVGHTPSLLNNEGYSYMLRGDLGKARAKFDEALRLDPNNATATNNLALLNESTRFVERAANGEPCGSVDCVQ